MPLPPPGVVAGQLTVTIKRYHSLIPPLARHPAVSTSFSALLYLSSISVCAAFVFAPKMA